MQKLFLLHMQHANTMSSPSCRLYISSEHAIAQQHPSQMGPVYLERWVPSCDPASGWAEILKPLGKVERTWWERLTSASQR